MKSPRIGIVGAGQLGRMMALAAYPLGIRCRFVETSDTSPGGQVAPIHVADLDDRSALETLAGESDVVTFEIENVDTDSLRALKKSVVVYPAPDAVAAAQDRLSEKTLFSALNIPTGPYRAIASETDLQDAARDLGLPLVLKARRLGYDGRGQRIVASGDELLPAWEELGRVPAIAEAFVDFDREVSLIGVRGTNGAFRTYPLSENVHADGILRTSIAPYASPSLQAMADRWMQQLMERFDYVGVLTIEFFAVGDSLLANEMAPRVHNSGHWTIEGAETSQFENHIRAVAGLPLGSTAPRGHAAMVNLLGEIPPKHELLAFPGLHLHDYGKSPRPGRKLGHCTLVDNDRAQLLERLAPVQALVAGLSTGTRTGDA